MRKDLTVHKILMIIEKAILVAEQHELLSREEMGTAYYDRALIKLMTLRQLWENITGEEFRQPVVAGPQ